VSRDYHFYIKDIIQSCDKILRYTDSVDFARFCANEEKYDAVVRNLEIIGEAAKYLSSEVKAKYPQIDWRKVAGLRDILIHAYFCIDNVILWDIVKIKIPELKGHYCGTFLVRRDHKLHCDLDRLKHYPQAISNQR